MNYISGIYKIQSICKPERIYIGSAVNIENRWWCHLCELRGNKHGNAKLQKHFRKYGEQDLQFSVILGCEREELIKNEQFFIDSYDPFFNICKIAGSNLGIKLSEETKKKIGDSKRGKPSWWRGKKKGPHTEEWKQKMREITIENGNKPPSALGLKRSEETKLKMSEILIGNKRSLGHKHTEESIEKMRRPKSEETKQKMSEAHKNRKKSLGQKHSEETKQKMRHPKSEETKQRMREAQRRLAALRKLKLLENKEDGVSTE